MKSTKELILSHSKPSLTLSASFFAALWRILEIKTAKDKKNWSKGVPINYRAQVLFYLHITNLDKAIVRVLINERETKDYTIYRDDELVPGSNVNMSLYIQDRVVPLLREWETM